MISAREHLRSGVVIPAHPLALTARRTLDEQRQCGLTRYYVDAGAGGIAVGVHTTQFAIRDSQYGLYRPVLELAAETANRELATTPNRAFVKVAGVCGHTAQALSEAQIAAALGYDVALLSLGDLQRENERELLLHCREVAEAIPLFGFYLQPAVGGRVLSYAFWREFAELPNVWAIKIAPFNRYQTIDVIRAVAEAGRDDIALYTGNDDNVILDLLTPFPVITHGERTVRWIDGGLLGQWACWTRAAVRLLERAKAARALPSMSGAWLQEAAALTDANGAIFDVAHAFRGCIPGIHDILRRQGLLRGIWCLDPHEQLSEGQVDEIDRVHRVYPELNDDDFVRENLARWLS
ncbi:MAG TPA: dihydrodipicolinate synthase family protein [Gemmatimonadaceae bacterium]|nr:dihydrodipicolinate synthase family protein [Gemmatimonadaceae bacterium]